MKALVTGASSGIGYDIAVELDSLGYDIIAVARNIDRLSELKSRLKNNTQIITADLSVPENCIALYDSLRVCKIDVLVNNAGFGLIGEFCESDLNRELEMINTNITAVHILTKLFLKDMKAANKGYILNVASIAGFMPGPLMATYYASKAYVVRLTQAIRKELQKSRSDVKISLLCPGPVHTRFNQTAGVEFNLKSLDSKYVASYAVSKMLKNKPVILPGLSIKLARFGGKFLPDSFLAEIAYHMQKKKI